MPWQTLGKASQKHRIPWLLQRKFINSRRKHLKKTKYMGIGWPPPFFSDAWENKKNFNGCLTLHILSLWRMDERMDKETCLTLELVQILAAKNWYMLLSICNKILIDFRTKQGVIKYHWLSQKKKWHFSTENLTCWSRDRFARQRSNIHI